MLMLEVAKEDLENLIRLQEIDAQIIKLEQKLKEIPLEIQKLESVAKTRRRKIENIDERIMLLSQRRQELENLINESYKKIEESKNMKKKGKEPRRLQSSN